MKVNTLWIDPSKAEQIAEKLNILLATNEIFYMSVHGMHWNIKGKEFFSLHAKFEEYYTESWERNDQIAERILMLGQQPLHCYECFLKNSKLKPIKDVFKAHDAMILLKENLNTLYQLEKDILDYAAKMNDDATADLMVKFIESDQKKLWMLSAWEIRL